MVQMLSIRSEGKIQDKHKLKPNPPSWDASARPPNVTLASVRDVQNIFFIILLRFGFGLFFEQKNSDSVGNEFGSVRFEKCSSVRILQLLMKKL